MNKEQQKPLTAEEVLKYAIEGEFVNVPRDQRTDFANGLDCPPRRVALAAMEQYSWQQTAQLRQELEQVKAQRDEAVNLLKWQQSDGRVSDALEDSIYTFLSSLTK